VNERAAARGRGATDGQSDEKMSALTRRRCAGGVGGARNGRPAINISAGPTRARDRGQLAIAHTGTASGARPAIRRPAVIPHRHSSARPTRLKPARIAINAVCTEGTPIKPRSYQNRRGSLRQGSAQIQPIAAITSQACTPPAIRKRRRARNVLGRIGWIQRNRLNRNRFYARIFHLQDVKPGRRNRRFVNGAFRDWSKDLPR